jgi:dolichol-phosphate mannosyltransferase
MKKVSIVTPAWNEAKNIPILYRHLCDVFEQLPDYTWEFIVIDDHSSDETFEVLKSIARKTPNVSGYRLSRNFGSHTAIACGLRHASGDCAIVMAADMQDPPTIIPKMITAWQNGDHIIWAIRSNRLGEKKTTIGFSRLYYLIMRYIVGMKSLPPTGSDFFLMDKVVINALNEFPEKNANLFALISWMGFRQGKITYEKKERAHGQSGWSLEKKLKLVVDSVTSFSYLPIRMISYVGFLIAFVGFIYAMIIIANALLISNPPTGWTSLMVVILVMGGVQMLMMGILGEYLWRALDEARRRPRFIIEESTPEGERASKPPTH